jgi:8-oxo-dGTP pyrophosphatase MutT (NUDIX family)
MLTTGDNGMSRWLTPGGGAEQGESHADAAARELFEETGLSGIDLGEPVFSLDFTATYGALDHDTGHAEYYTAVVDRFEPSDANWTEDEKIDVLAHRWWTLEELESTTEPFEPPQLLELIRSATLNPGE